jgi:hypothetical protein
MKNWPQKLMLAIVVCVTIGIYAMMQADISKSSMVIDVNMRRGADPVQTLNKILPSDAEVISIEQNSNHMTIKIRTRLKKETLLRYLLNLGEIEEAKVD